MGRNCGYLAETARRYHDLLQTKQWASSMGEIEALGRPLSSAGMSWDPAVAAGPKRSGIMDEQGNVNFLSRARASPRSSRMGPRSGRFSATAASGSNTINPGQWFAKHSPISGPRGP